MPTRPLSAAIYARISSDVDGSGLGVQRQLEDCSALARANGWTVGREYVDNDLSAYSGKLRPAYQQMLTDIRDRLRDGVIVYHLDRLTRRPIELEHFLAAIDAAQVRHVSFVTGDMDLGTGDGLLVARIQAAVAANASANQSKRVKRKMDQNAALGVPHGGFRRPFGFDDDKLTIRPAEAAIIRQVAERYIARESLRSICLWLDADNVRTVGGKGWRTPTLRAMLASGRIAGLRDHRGQVIGPAAWQPIITQADRDKILARMTEAATTKRRTPRRYLLSGLLRCGRCGNRLFASPRRDTRRYVCLSGPDHRGCGRLTVTALPLEQLVAHAVLYRLDTPSLAAALAGRAAEDEQAMIVADSLAVDRAQLAELAGLYGTRQVGATEWLAARLPIEQRIAEGQRRLARVTRTEALTGLAHGDELRAQWGGLNLTRQAEIVTALIDHVVIAGGTPGAQSLDPERVRPVWRV